MVEGYVHYEITRAQAPMKPGTVSGDIMGKDRTPMATTVVLVDGIGHGVKAHIAAQLCVSRLLGLISTGAGARHAFESVVKTMEQAKGTDMPYAVVTLARILPDGVATVLSYEMPPPILVMRRFSQVLPQRPITGLAGVAYESNCHLAVDESLLIVSDGITQSGLGHGMHYGWTAEGVARYVSDCQGDGIEWTSIPNAVLSRARKNWGAKLGDDCSAVLITARTGKTVSILTGPPSDRRLDRKVVQKFMAMKGAKVVSGGTTAKIVADYLGKELVVEKKLVNLFSPPRYFIEGIDLVTEGALTLNQVYNVLDESPNRLEQGSVAQLHRLIHEADRVNFIVGEAVNPANANIAFQQQGILTRQTVIPLICEKLRAKGKLVIEEHI
ncbi:MAG: Stage II sporulation protein E (SpoIIE) [Firmicutes bacterium ADurb.Bin153]|nr:MAG: Stage II sporulation protein E (SpoIIE) [Firmicutes bacterium ADurb.Bin153]HPU95383.1 SpoIIE family protein phosphatase [Bacillota bacterium]